MTNKAMWYIVTVYNVPCAMYVNPTKALQRYIDIMTEGQHSEVKKHITPMNPINLPYTVSQLVGGKKPGIVPLLDASNAMGNLAKIASTALYSDGQHPDETIERVMRRSNEIKAISDVIYNLFHHSPVSTSPGWWDEIVIRMMEDGYKPGVFFDITKPITGNWMHQIEFVNYSPTVSGPIHFFQPMLWDPDNMKLPAYYKSLCNQYNSIYYVELINAHYITADEKHCKKCGNSLKKLVQASETIPEFEGE